VNAPASAVIGTAAEAAADGVLAAGATARGAAPPSAARARQRLPQPSGWLVAGLGGWGVVGILASIGWIPERGWQWFGAALLLLAGADLFRLLRRPTPQVRREVADALALGLWHSVSLHLTSGGVRQVLDVHDHHPGGWAVDGQPRRMALRAGAVATLDYQVRPLLRGAFTFDGVALRLLSPLRLWRHPRHVEAAQRVRVLPNLAPLTRLAWLRAEHASRLVGVHPKRRRGEGTDFHQMRDYRVGDSLRQIDWKATRRARRLMSRDYQDEQNQQVLLVLDSGRRMLARDGELSHFDQALDACLLLAHLALRRGDAAGLFVTGAAPRWVLPRRGAGALQAILRASYDLQPDALATDYLALARELSLRQCRRALLLLVTNLRDEDVDDVLAGVRLLQQRHVVVVASLRERALDDALDAPITDVADAVRVSASAHYLAARAAAHAALRRHRIAVLDVTAEQLPAALVEQYLAIKRAGRL